MKEINLPTVKKAYARDGFVFIPGFVEPEMLKRIQEELKTFIREEVPVMPAQFVFYEDKRDPATLKQLQDMHRYSLFFDRLLKESRFSEMAEALLGESVIPQNLEYFNKPCKTGKPTPAHQDGFYFMLNPPQAVTMWMALEKADQENGCVRYIPGSHTRGMRRHGRTATLGFSQGIVDYREEDFAKEIPLPAEPGDLLIHHAMTIHRADGNQSNRSRRALGFIYFGASAQEDTEAKEAYQQKLRAERTEGQAAG